MNNPDLVTRLVFNDTVVLEISPGHETAVNMCISRNGDKEDEGKSVQLYADEIDLLIATLSLYRKRATSSN